QESFLMPDQGTGSAIVNVVTKSGTNQLHGEAFEFLRNGAMDARSFFASGPENLKRNQFGLAMGGPMRKDRLWFHAFYEGLRELTAFSVAGYSPTAAMFAGNFSETGRVIYDPGSYSPASGNRQPFPDFAIPASRINAVARNLLAYYLPGDSLLNRPSNLYGNPRTTLDDNQSGLRIDWAPSPRAQMLARLFVQDSPSKQPGLFPLSGLLYLNEAQLGIIQHVWSHGSNLVNTLRFGF